MARSLRVLGRSVAMVLCLGTLVACQKSGNHAEGGAESAGGERPKCLTKGTVRGEGTPPERLDCLLEVAGAGQVFRGSELRESIREQILPKLDFAGPAARAEVERVIETRFDDQALEQRFRELFLAQYDEKNVKELLSFYASPLGTRLAAQREEDATADEMKAWFDEHEPTERRVDEVAEILQASHALESVAVMVRLPVEGMVAAMAPLEAGAAMPTEDEIRALLTPAIESAQTAVAAHTIYSMRVFDEDELSKLADFERRPAAQWYHENLLLSVTAALAEAFGALTAAVTQAAGVPV